MDCETTGLHPSDSSLIAIGVVVTEADGGRQGQVFHVNPCGSSGEDTASEPSISEQLRIIQEFVDTLDEPAPGAKLYTYNGDGFDWPFLVSKAMRKDDYGELNKELSDLWTKHGHDLMRSHGTSNGYSKKLEDLLQENGLSHNGDISGKNVPQYFREGKLDKICSYLKEDVKKTDKLVEKLCY